MEEGHDFLPSGAWPSDEQRPSGGHTPAFTIASGRSSLTGGQSSAPLSPLIPSSNGQTVQPPAAIYRAPPNRISRAASFSGLAKSMDQSAMFTRQKSGPTAPTSRDLLELVRTRIMGATEDLPAMFDPSSSAEAVVRELDDRTAKDILVKLLEAGTLLMQPTAEDEAEAEFDMMPRPSITLQDNTNSGSATPRMLLPTMSGATVPPAFGTLPVPIEDTSSAVQPDGLDAPMLDVSVALSVQSVSRPAVANTSELRKAVDDDGSKTVNQYVILDELGRGAQGKVKLAFDTSDNGMRAIKIVRRPQGIAAGGARNVVERHRSALRLKKEVAILKKMRHRNVIRLYEVIDDPGSAKLYLVMQYAARGPVAQLGTDSTSDPIPYQRLTDIARQMCNGLAYLHSHGVVHRDIKPDNVLLSDDGTVLLADFGVSEIAGPDQSNPLDPAATSGGGAGSSPPPVRKQRKSIVQFSGVTDEAESAEQRRVRVNGMNGTLAFMAPEAFAAAAAEAAGRSSTTPSLPVTPENRSPSSSPPTFHRDRVQGQPPPQQSQGIDGYAADVWALGVTLYLLTMGKLPFGSYDEDEGEGAADTMETLGDAGLAIPAAVAVARATENAARAVNRPLEFPNADKLPEPIPAQWFDVIRSALQRDPANRPTVQQLRKLVKAMDTARNGNTLRADSRPERESTQAPDDDVHELSFTKSPGTSNIPPPPIAGSMKIDVMGGAEPLDPPSGFVQGAGPLSCTTGTDDVSTSLLTTRDDPKSVSDRTSDDEGENVIQTVNRGSGAQLAVSAMEVDEAITSGAFVVPNSHPTSAMMSALTSMSANSSPRAAAAFAARGGLAKATGVAIPENAVILPKVYEGLRSGQLSPRAHRDTHGDMASSLPPVPPSPRDGLDHARTPTPRGTSPSQSLRKDSSTSSGQEENASPLLASVRIRRRSSNASKVGENSFSSPSGSPPASLSVSKKDPKDSREPSQS